MRTQQTNGAARAAVDPPSRHRRAARLRLVTPAVVSALALAGCAMPGSAEGSGSGTAAESAAPTTQSPSTRPSGGTGAPSGQPPDAPPEVGEPIRPSLAQYFDEVPEASDVRLGRVRERTAAFTSYDVSYRSDRMRITGVLNVPTGRGPFPAVVLAHGWGTLGAWCAVGLATH